MSYSIQTNYFKPAGEKEYKKINFRNYIFKELKFKGNNKEYFSFYRSDFRAVKIINCSFTLVSFDMVDFIDNVFEDSKFSYCDFGNSEIKNGYFSNTQFSHNHYLSSIQKSIFNDCQFINETFCATAHEVTFKNCLFRNCDFEGSTFEDIKFENCIIEDCELSTMHAENFTFNQGYLNNVVWGIDYWFTYLISECSIQNIKLKYRGEYVDIIKNEKLISDILNDLIKQHCYFEYLNILILQQSISGKDQISISNHLSLYDKAFSSLINEDDVLHRQKQLLSIFNMMNFYFFKDNFDLYSVLCVIEYINSLNFDLLPVDESIIYKAEIYKINEKFCELPYSYEQIANIPMDHQLYAQIKLDYDNLDDALNFIDTAFDLLASITGKKDGYKYKIISAKKGSWTIEILAASAAILIIYKIIKDSTTFCLKTRIQIKLSSIVIDGINGKTHPKKQLDNLERSVKLLEETGLFESDEKNLFTKSQLSKIISLVISFFENNTK